MTAPNALSDDDVTRFVTDGYVALRGAFPPRPAERAVPATEHRPVVEATGAAGDVFLCHPLLVHAAQPHRGTTPKFMAATAAGPGRTARSRPPRLARRARGAGCPVGLLSITEA